MRTFMTVLVSGVVAAVLVSAQTFGVLVAQQKDKQPAPKAPQVKVDKTEVKAGGRVNVDVEVGRLPKFDKPKDPPKDPPKEKPKDKDGKERAGHWHWHRWHGWVLLPQPLATVVIPDGYVLPPRVTYWAAPTVLPVRVICPHCGQPIYVYCD